MVRISTSPSVELLDSPETLPDAPLSVRASSPAIARHPVLVVGGRGNEQEAFSALQREGWSAEAVENAQQASALLLSRSFAFIVLDWSLHEEESFSLLRFVQQRRLHVPVLFTPLDELSSGARFTRIVDEAQPSLEPTAFTPFLGLSVPLAKRTRGQRRTVLRYRDFTLDPRSRLAERGGRTVPLTPRDVDVLEFLIRHAGRAVSREALQNEVWKQPNRLTSLNNVIDVHIMRLRRKLKELPGDRLLFTLRGVGYRFGMPS